MSWTCPNCNRTFRNRRQWHSCQTTSIEEHLKGKAEEVIDIFNRLLTICSRFGLFEINPVKSSIQFRNGATFLGVKLKKDKVEIEFFLKKERSHTFISKSIRISGQRIFSSAVLKSVDDLDDDAVCLIKESYNLAANQVNKTSK